MFDRTAIHRWTMTKKRVESRGASLDDVEVFRSFMISSKYVDTQIALPYRLSRPPRSIVYNTTVVLT